MHSSRSGCAITSAGTTSRLTLQSVPPDAMNGILSQLSYPSIVSLLSTCKTFHAPAAFPDSALWRAVAASRPLSPPLGLAPNYRRKAQLADAAVTHFCASVSNTTQDLHVPVTRVIAGPHGTLAGAGPALVAVWQRGTWGGDASVVSAREARDVGSGAVSAMAFDGGARKLAVATRNATVIYDVSRSTLLPGRAIRGHTTNVMALSFCGKTEELLCSAAQDGALRLVNATTRRARGVLRGHGSPVSFLAALRRSGFIVSSGSSVEARLKIWDLESQTCVTTERFPDALSAIRVDVARDTAYVATAAGVVRVLDLRAGSTDTAAVLSLPRRWGKARINALALRKDGLLAAGVGGGGAAVWDPRGPWEGRGIGWPGYGGHRESRRICAIAASTYAVVLGCADGRVSVLGLEGEYSGPVGGTGEDSKGRREGSRQSAVRSLIVGGEREELLVVGRRDGAAQVVNMLSREVMVDWGKASSACGLERGGSRFWVN